jgi:hypothetical protein
MKLQCEFLGKGKHPGALRSPPGRSFMLHAFYWCPIFLETYKSHRACKSIHNSQRWGKPKWKMWWYRVISVVPTKSVLIIYSFPPIVLFWKRKHSRLFSEVERHREMTRKGKGRTHMTGLFPDSPNYRTTKRNSKIYEE